MNAIFWLVLIYYSTEYFENLRGNIPHKSLFLFFNSDNKDLIHSSLPSLGLVAMQWLDFRKQLLSNQKGFTG